MKKNEVGPTNWAEKVRKTMREKERDQLLTGKAEVGTAPQDRLGGGGGLAKKKRAMHRR